MECMSGLRNIVKKAIPTKLFEKLEPTGHSVEAIASNIKSGFPSKKMHVIGVTGTNGKTTTTLMIYQMLHEAGYKVGVLSTVAYGANGKLEPQVEHMTTVQASVLQRRLKAFKEQGVEWVVIETSSHALAQYRVWGIPIEIGVFTNLTRDHLDYHKTMKRYLHAKLKLFEIVSKNGRKFGVVNADDKYSKYFAELVPRSVSYGIKSGDLKAYDIKFKVDHSIYKVKIKDDVYNIKVNVIGDFNISNSLAAVAVGREIGLSKEQIEKGIAATKSVEGRVSSIKQGQKFNVLVDFASTPDAFERIFNTIRPVVKGKLIAVFGSAGRRDEVKRALQGKIAGKYADEIIITEEDDRDVDGNEIMNQIAEGVEKSGKKLGKNYFKILDRKEAIEFALTRASSEQDTVILLGKGHEKTIERANETIDWNESEVVKKLLKELIKR